MRDKEPWLSQKPAMMKLKSFGRGIIVEMTSSPQVQSVAQSSFVSTVSYIVYCYA